MGFFASPNFPGTGESNTNFTNHNLIKMPKQNKRAVADVSTPSSTKKARQEDEEEDMEEDEEDMNDKPGTIGEKGPDGVPITIPYVHGNRVMGYFPKFDTVLRDFAMNVRLSCDPPGMYLYDANINEWGFVAERDYFATFQHLGFSERLKGTKGKPGRWVDELFIKRWRSLPPDPALFTTHKGIMYCDFRPGVDAAMELLGVSFTYTLGGGANIGCEQAKRKNEPKPMNLWTGYMVELYDPVGPDEFDHQFIHDFETLIWNLSGERETREITEPGRSNPDYLALLHSTAFLFQYPHRQQFAISIQGGKGIGKNTFCNILTALCGEFKVEEITNPKRDLYGNFNSPIKTAKVIVCNEAKESDVDFEQLKALITDKRRRVGEKFIKVQTVSRYQWFLFFSNADGAPLIDWEAAERRIMAAKASNNLKRYSPGEAGYDAVISPLNDVFFTRINRAMKDAKSLRSLYQYLFGMNISLFDPTTPVITQFQRDSMSEGEPFETQFFRHLVNANSRTYIKKLGNGGDQDSLYGDYMVFVSSSLESYNRTLSAKGKKIHAPVSPIKLINMIKAIAEKLRMKDQIKQVKTQDCNKWDIDVDAFKPHFKVAE